MPKTNKYQGKHQIEISVSDFILRNAGTGVETFIDTVATETLEKSSSVTKIKAGINADTIFSISSDEEITLTIEDVLSRQELLKAKWGFVDKTGVIKKTIFPANYTVLASKKITLPQAPLNTADVIVYQGSTALVPTTDYTVSGTDITIVKAGINVGDQLFVSSYEYTAASGEYAEVASGSSSLVFEVIRKKPIFDSNLQITGYKYTHFPKATLSTSATETAETERTQQNSTLEFSIEKHPSYSYVMRTWEETV